jgi:hypothetical protein
MKNSSPSKDDKNFILNRELQQSIEQYSQALENLANKIQGILNGKNEFVLNRELEQAILETIIENHPPGFEDLVNKINLNKNTKSAISLEEYIFNILVLRDKIQKLLEESPVISIHQEQTLAQLDKQLKNQSKRIKRNNKLPPWTKSLKPIPNYWLWFIKPNNWNRFDKVWDFLALICLTAFASYIATILPKFAVGGFSFFKNLGILATSGLTLGLIITLLTQNGRNFFKFILSELNLNPKFHSEITAIISVFLVGCLFLFDFWALPATSDFYLEKGKFNFYQRQFSESKSQFEQAIEFNEKNYEAHAYLGITYEFIRDFDKAQSHYKTATENESPLPLACNNLARLYIFKQEYKDAEAMLLTLEDIIENTNNLEENLKFKFAFHKNSAWLQLEKYKQEQSKKNKNYQSKNKDELLYRALDNITQAIDISREEQIENRDGNCIYAEILYKLDRSDDADREVNNCLNNNQFDTIIDTYWIAELKNYTNNSLSIPSSNLVKSPFATKSIKVDEDEPDVTRRIDEYEPDGMD